jgi:hypothetical protein
MNKKGDDKRKKKYEEIRDERFKLKPKRVHYPVAQDTSPSTPLFLMPYLYSVNSEINYKLNYDILCWTEAQMVTTWNTNKSPIICCFQLQIC